MELTVGESPPRPLLLPPGHPQNFSYLTALKGAPWFEEH